MGMLRKTEYTLLDRPEKHRPSRITGRRPLIACAQYSGCVKSRLANYVWGQIDRQHGVKVFADARSATRAELDLYIPQLSTREYVVPAI